jgi:16S rRNA processing protein RimM
VAESKRDARVCVAVIGAPHGVRGAVRIRCFTEDPDAVAAYGVLETESGKRLSLARVGVAKGGILAEIDGVTDRNAAALLRGTRLFVPRSALPEPEEEEYYYDDLIGLAVETVDGRPVGEVRAVHDYGAGDILEVAAGTTARARDRQGGRRPRPVLVPFTREIVPEVRLDERRIIIDPPPGLLEA